MRRDMSFRSGSRNSASRKTRGSYARQLSYESLEDRRLLATTAAFNAGTGELLITMPAPADKATVTLLANGNYQVTNQAAVDITPAPTPTFANVVRLTVTGGAGAQEFTLNGAMDPETGIDISDVTVETVNLTGDITNTAGGIVVIQPAAGSIVNLNSNMRTNGGAVVMPGAINLTGNVELDTDLAATGVGSNAAQVVLGAVNGAFSLKIDATADQGGLGGFVAFNNIGAAAALTRFEALTTDIVDFTGGDFMMTDGGPVILQATTLDMAGPDDFIDTEQGGNDPGAPRISPASAKSETLALPSRTSFK